jgi:hypothetical protein
MRGSAAGSGADEIKSYNLSYIGGAGASGIEDGSIN